MIVFINEGGKKIGYYSSDSIYNSGDILTPENVKNNSHLWSDNKRKVENLIEKIRIERFSNVISRLNCIFINPTQKSRFSNHRTYLYEVEYMGKYHYADSDLIDAIFDYTHPSIDYTKINVEDEKPLLFEKIIKYWNGNLSNRNNVEILTEKIIIIKRIKKDLSKDDVITLDRHVSAKKFDENGFTDITLKKGSKLLITNNPTKSKKGYYIYGYIYDEHTDKIIDNQTFIFFY